MKKSKSSIIATFSAAMAMHSAAPAKESMTNVDANGTPSTQSRMETGETTLTAEAVTFTKPVDIGAAPLMPLMTPRFLDEWTDENESSYSALVTKEATGELRVAEFHQLERLQNHRRRMLNPPTGEEVLFRYRQEKFDSELLALVNRYVRPDYPKNKTGVKTS